MARMTTADAAVAILRREGVTNVFGLPGAAINPFYAAMRRDEGISHTLARHVEGASHMAEGYTRAHAGNIGVCVGTSGPAGTDMLTGLYSAAADSIPILCITGQAPVAKLHKEDFQAVNISAIAAQFKLPYIHVLVNNAYLGLIRQSQRGFAMDYCVQLSFDNINAPEVGGYGVDHVKVAEGLGCKALRVTAPDEIGPAFEVARKLMAEYRVPVVVEVILERVTNISMGTELDNVVEFEDPAARREDAPTAVVAMLD